MRLAKAAACAVALIATACGSTAHIQRASVDAETSAPEFEMGGGAPAEAAPDAAGATNPVGRAAPARVGAPGGTATPVAGTRGTAGQGVTSAEIRIGLVRIENAGSLAAAAGTPGQGDANAQQRAMLDEINEAGGIAGRRVVPVFHPVSETTTESFAALEEAACATWTEDDRVFAVLSHPAIGLSDNLRTCLEERGVVLIGGGLNVADASTYARFKHHASTGAPPLNRLAQSLATNLAQAGYFGSGAKIGVLTYDLPVFRRAVDNALVPALRGQGRTVTRTVLISPPERTSDFANESAQASSAVLRLQSDGVTHVLILERAGSLALSFMTAAESQRYRPRYGLTSASGGQLTATLVPQGQAVGAVSVGWIPLVDVGDGAEFAAPTGYQRCLDVMSRRGVTLQEITARRAAAETCDVFEVFRVAAAAPGPGLNRSSFMSSLAGLGTAAAGAQVHQLNFGNGRPDGAGGVRVTRFDTSCGCFRFASPLQPL